MEKKTILCVDDDGFYGDLYKQILEAKGYAVALAQNPQDGYDAVLREIPALIILDVMMPEKGAFRDGFDLLEKLRSEDRTKRVPVIMISALGSQDDVQHGLDLGASVYMAKHETVPEKLVAEIERLITASEEAR